MTIMSSTVTNPWSTTSGEDDLPSLSDTFAEEARQLEFLEFQLDMLENERDSRLRTREVLQEENHYLNDSFLQHCKGMSLQEQRASLSHQDITTTELSSRDICYLLTAANNELRQKIGDMYEEKLALTERVTHLEHEEVALKTIDQSLFATLPLFSGSSSLPPPSTTAAATDHSTPHDQFDRVLKYTTDKASQVASFDAAQIPTHRLRIPPLNITSGELTFSQSPEWQNIVQATLDRTGDLLSGDALDYFLNASSEYALAHARHQLYAKATLSARNSKGKGPTDTVAPIPANEEVDLSPKDEHVHFNFDLQDSDTNVLYSRPIETATPDDGGKVEIDRQEVKCASLCKLIERLTYEKYPDPNFTFVFLLTYRSFTTPLTLLRLLRERFIVPTPHNLSPMEIDYFERMKTIPIHLRVVNVLKHWVEKYFYDFENDPDLVNEFYDFIDTQIAQSTRLANAGKQLRKLIEKKISNAKKEVVITPGIMPKVELPKNDVEVEGILDFPEIEIARQFTLCEFELFRAIQPKECLNQAWSRKGQQKIHAPNIIAMIERFNATSRWVATEMVREVDLKKRTFLLRKFIKIAEQLRNLHNFNGAMEIMAGLHSASIHRLKKTWEGLSNFRMDKFHTLETLLSNAQNYKQLRETLGQTPAPCIPYLGMYLSDLTFIEDGNPDRLNDMINFVKRRKVANVIRQIQQYQQTPYSLETVDQLRAMITHLPHLMDDQLYSESLLRETRT